MGPAVKTVRLIQIAMLVSIGIYAVVGEVAGRHLNTDATVIYAISFASISLVGAILVVRKTMVLQSEAELKAKPGDPVILARWKTGYFVTYALCEALALFGLVLAGSPTPFTRCSPAAQDARLETWRHSRVALLRSGYQALKRLTQATYYSSPEVYALVGYPGPPEVPRGPA